jgi:hypothetical protein
MSQVIENKEVEQPAPFVNLTPTHIGIGYVVLVILPVLLKVLGITFVAAWPWSKVTATIWGPWLLTVVISALGWLVYLVQTRRG